MRGAKSLSVRHAKNTKSAQIYLYEIRWVMTATVSSAITLICLAHLSLSAYLMHKAGLLFKKPNPLDDSAKIVKRGGF